MIRLASSPVIKMAIAMIFLFTLLAPVTGSQAADPASPSQPSAASANILEIPITTAPVTVDGVCNAANEYGTSSIQTFTDGNGKPATVYLTSSGGQLFVCMRAQIGSFANIFGRVYLDPQADGGSYVFANQGDDAFQANLTKTPILSAYHGNGAPNGWTAASFPVGSWNGAAAGGAAVGFETYEFSLSQKSLAFGENCSLFGLSVFHHWFAGTGDDYSWPAGSIFDQPRTWQLARIGAAGSCGKANVAYVYRGNKEDAASFFNLLTSNGYFVDLIPLSAITAAGPDFSIYTLIIIADDTGSLNQWGSSGLTAAQVARIKAPNIPILGLGEGGYSFFGQLNLFIGWPQGWHGPQSIMNMASGSPAGFFNPPVPPVTHYTVPFNSVGIYLNPNQSVPADVTPIGLEDPLDDHSSLIRQGCDFLWGNSGNPLIMTADGKLIFLNTVSAVFGFQCATLPPPTTPCLVITKANGLPLNGPVTPGQQITYTIKYTYSSDKACGNQGDAKIIDFVPPDTTFVPGSAVPAISPGADGSLVWSVSPAVGSRTVSFKVIVSETQCTNQRMVNNQARLLAYGFSPIATGILSNPVTCPSVTFPSHSPFYAEDELQVTPYPLVAGSPSQVSVRLTNSGATPVTVTAQFQISPSGLGAGLPYSTFATRTATIPAASAIILKSPYTPRVSGLACFQVSVTVPGQAQVLKTQSCLDNIEDFSTGAAQNLVFPVGNPTSTAGTVMLVVDNTCPGWSASITIPASGVFTGVGPNDTDIRSATLHVTPPSPVTLGSGCHIDVQAWITNPTTSIPEMIGGVRKLDVPPVHLPSNINPPWEEPEIVFVPDPPVLGRPGQVCVVLNNPTTHSKTVTLQFDEADFGAGIGFTPIGSQNFILPPSSVNKYCIPWTPPATGTIHRCILVHLRQVGYQEMRSQRNVDLVRYTQPLNTLDIPITIGNPDLIDHHVTFKLQSFGINPYWLPFISPNPGDPPPDLIPGGRRLLVHLMFKPAVVALAAPPDFHFGDASQVSVAVFLDGQPASGFTLLLGNTKTFLPTVKK
jgi:uncharacterized repeat protein (TIGR01451 family)